MGYYFQPGWALDEEKESTKALKELLNVLLMSDEELEEYMKEAIDNDPGDFPLDDDSEIELF